MLRQSDFYQAIVSLKGVTQVQSAFRQIGDAAQAGYLPKNSSGACSYTTLDFHRAVSQGCEAQWMSAAEQAKKGSSLWQATLGTPGNSFGLRQQLQYVSSEHIVKDRLYTRSLPDDQGQSLVDSIVPNSRLVKAQLESFSPRDLTRGIDALLNENPQTSIRLNFNIVDANNRQYGHSIAICQSRDGQNVYIMDPNVGVIATNKEEMPFVLEALRSSLYKDYTLSDTSLETQEKFWLDPAHPLTDDQIRRFKAEEVALLTACTPDYYKAHLEAQAAKPVDDCDFEEEAVTTAKKEAVFDDAEWDGLAEVAVAATAVAVGAREYKAMVHDHPPQPTVATAAVMTSPKSDEWDMVNETRPGFS